MKWNGKHVAGMIKMIVFSVFLACTGNAPVLIGFSGELTGSNADLGVQGRNGAILAIESVNESGGINGRPIELIVQDDGGTPTGAKAADSALIEANVVAIVGHMTSGQSMAALPVIEKAGMLMLSPTTSTSLLTGIDDHFLRVQPAITAAAGKLARIARSQYRAERIVVIADQDNLAYSDAFRKAFVDTFEKTGGHLSENLFFSSSSHPDFDELMRPISPSNVNGLLIIASARDTAFIAQHLRNNGFSCPLFSSGWAQTNTLIQNGGKAVEGLILVADYDIDSRKPAFETFRLRYRERFGRPPTFAAAQSYEAMNLLAKALKQTGGNRSGLKEALLGINDFQGLLGNIKMDPYGDVIRTQFVVTVKNGNFQTLSAIET
ncbi:ABC transporter substrate-binding protein [Desulfosarcina widdelii]|uniref:ABC transporter substrate-binding protein n=2 Tax=Desulfosarcina widdelii TaxID=947919 RepID=A0A5K7Z557_9BACT|nr:ABC transporter substrate-binding protein [Desulfosarcina widdelii]